MSRACEGGTPFSHAPREAIGRGHDEVASRGAEGHGGRPKNGSCRDSIERREWRNTYVRFIAFVAAIGGFLFGFDLGMIGAANIYLRDQFHLNDAQLGFATASAVLGCIFGPFLGAWLCDAIGRKRTMIIAAFLLAVSAVLTAVPDFLPGMSDRRRWRCLTSFGPSVDWAWGCARSPRRCTSPKWRRLHGEADWG